MSSSNLRLIDYLGSGFERVEHFPCEVSFHAPEGFHFGVPFGEFLRHIVLGSRVGSESADRDDVQGRVGLPVTTPVEPVTVCFA